MTQENKDIQSKDEPYVVKSHDIHIDSDYADWIADIKNRYRSAQVKAAVKVNAEKLLFNWELGRDLVQKKAEERWGTGVVEQQKTGKWLAEQMGKSACTVSKWCSNSSQPDLATLDKIATLLNVDRRELIAPSK